MKLYDDLYRLYAGLRKIGGRQYVKDLKHGRTPKLGYRYKADVWAEYPWEKESEHEGHRRAKTLAPKVNYCYTCGKHYRPL